MIPGSMVGRRVRYWDMANPLTHGTVSRHIPDPKWGGFYEITWDGDGSMTGTTTLPERIVDRMRVETPETRHVASWALLPVTEVARG